MATRATAGLSQAERDLQKYATGKAYKLMQDVAQFADIIELTTSDAWSCVGSTFLRLAATIAVNSNVSRDWWLQTCAATYDCCDEVKEIVG
jgi:hypothetical protein